MQVNALDLYNYISGNSANNNVTSFNSVSIFSDLFAADADTIGELLDLGFSEEQIEQKFVQLAEMTQDKTLINSVKSKVSSLLEEAKEEGPKTSETTSLNQEVSKTAQNKSATNTSNSSKSPISISSSNWNMENAGNIFAAGTSLENFTSSFNELFANAGSAGGAEYLNSINTIGSQNFFNAIDANHNGVLDGNEINSFINQDGDATSISASEFNNIFSQTSTNLNQTSTQTNNKIPTKETAASNKNKTSKSGGSGGGSSPSSSSTPSTSSTATQGESLEELRKQREQIITDSDKEIADLNTQLQAKIDSTNVDATLKTQYQDAKTKYDENETQIKNNQAQLTQYSSDLHTIETSLASANSEKGNLKTDTEDAEVNKNNAARIAELDKTIKDLTAEQNRIQGLKDALDAENKGLEGQRPDLQKTMNDALTALSAGLPPEVQQEIAALQEQISAAESNKTTKLGEIDAKIKTKETEEVDKSKTEGQQLGSLASDQFGNNVVQTALKYLGDSESNGRYKKFSSGPYGWCADFVTYVVQEVCKEGGMSDSEVKAVRKHLGASPYKLRSRNDGHYYNTKGMSGSEREDFIKNTLKPGMAFICKGSGASGEHTGFVAEVNYEKGTIVTVEGNSDNKVKQNTRKISDLYGFVDFTYLYNG